MSVPLNVLIEQGFLHLSRRQPEIFATPLTFALASGVQVQVLAAGVIEFTPASANLPASKDIVLSCGVHGNETAPIEICEQLVQQLLAGELALAQRVLFIFANLPAMDIAERFVEENMNRLFSGAHSQGDGLINTERHRAKALEAFVSDFYQQGQGSQRIHYDLHTAIRRSKNEKFAVYPFLHGNAHKISELQFLQACGVSTILLSDAPTTTFSYFSSRHFSADAFTVELGQVKPFGQNDMARFVQAQQSLAALLSQVTLDLPAYRREDFLLYRVNQVINRTHQDFRLNFADDLPNFSDFAQGEVLAEEPGQCYVAEQDGEAIVFPNAKVALGQRALLTVVPGELTTE